MIYLIVGDVHLDKHRRLADTKSLLDFVVDTADKEQCGTVIQLGDLYETRRPYQEEMRTAENFVKSLVRTGKRVILLAGNHDSTGIQSAIDEFRELSVNNVEVYNQPSVVDGIFIGHFGLQESAMGAYDFRSPRFMPMSTMVVRWPGCRLYALGDIHKPQILNRSPLIFHSGSIDRVDFGERNEEKYVWTWNSETEELKSILVPTRPMIQVDGKFVDGQLRWAKPKANFTGAVVKILVSGNPTELRKVDEPLLRGEYSTAYSLTIQYDVVRESSLKKFKETGIAEGITPAEALTTYVRSLSLDKESENTVLELGKEIIEKHGRN